MAINNSKLEIFHIMRMLEKEPSHGRELARKSGYSHTFINKLLSQYYKKGYLNKHRTGRTVIYSIKRDLMTKQLLIMEKKLRIVELMEKDKDFKVIIDEVMGRIKTISKEVICIILFGSYADLTYRKGSDIDLFFISGLSKSRITKEISVIEEKYGKEINVKVLILKDFIDKRGEILIEEALEGIPLYNSEIFYDLKWK
jgi:predicted nucleotidyltransferase